MLHDSNFNYNIEGEDFMIVNGKLIPLGRCCIGMDEFFNYVKTTTITRTIQNGPATIVFWEDGTKTVVKRSKNDPESDVYSAVAYALAKKRYRSNSRFKKLVDEHLEVKNRND